MMVTKSTSRYPQDNEKDMPTFLSQDLLVCFLVEENKDGTGNTTYTHQTEYYFVSVAMYEFILASLTTQKMICFCHREGFPLKQKNDVEKDRWLKNLNWCTYATKSICTPMSTIHFLQVVLNLSRFVWELSSFQFE